MSKRITIKDIAERASVSIGSVHCALYGKPGVGDATRERIIETAAGLGYKPNSAAASLKRKPLRIAVSFPGNTAESRYYFGFIWNGIRDWFSVQNDLNLEIVEAPFSPGQKSHAEVLGELLNGQHIDGLITTGETNAEGAACILSTIDSGIPVVLVSTDLPLSHRLCCVLPDYDAVGRIMAELISRQIPKDAGILLCAGEVDTPSHYMIANGFCAYMKEQQMRNPLYKIHPVNLSRESLDMLSFSIMNHPDIGACVAVNARGSLLLGRAIDSLGLKGKVIALGNDMFGENLECLRSGIFTNLVDKRPYTQAYTAAKYMTEYLMSGKMPPLDTVYVSSEVVFKSSLTTNSYLNPLL